MSVGKYSPWEHTATLPSAGAAVDSAARGASAPTEGGRGGAYRGGRPPTINYASEKKKLKKTKIRTFDLSFFKLKNLDF